MFGRIALAGALVWAGLCADARADVLSPAPRDCPPGTEARDCHGPPLCAPVTCSDDASCGAGTHCEARAFCTNDQHCTGRARSEPVKNAQPRCDNGESCPKWAACTTLRVCVANEPAPPQVPRPPTTPPDPGQSTSAVAPRSGPPPTAEPSRPRSVQSCSCRLDADTTDGAEVLLCAGLGGAALALAIAARRRGRPPRG